MSALFAYTQLPQIFDIFPFLQNRNSWNFHVLYNSIHIHFKIKFNSISKTYLKLATNKLSFFVTIILIYVCYLCLFIEYNLHKVLIIFVTAQNLWRQPSYSQVCWEGLQLKSSSMPMKYCSLNTCSKCTSYKFEYFSLRFIGTVLVDLKDRPSSQTTSWKCTAASVCRPLLGNRNGPSFRNQITLFRN